MNAEIVKLINSGNSYTILRNIYYEAARKFALESGADTSSPVNRDVNDSIQFLMNVNGINYFIYFARHIDGSTYLGVNNADEQQRLFKEKIASANYNIAQSGNKSAKNALNKKEKELSNEQCTKVLRYFVLLQNLYADGFKLINKLSELTGIHPEKLVETGFEGLPNYSMIIKDIYSKQNKSQEIVEKLSELTEISPEELIDSNFSGLIKYFEQAKRG